MSAISNLLNSFPKAESVTFRGAPDLSVSGRSGISGVWRIESDEDDHQEAKVAIPDLHILHRVTVYSGPCK